MIDLILQETYVGRLYTKRLLEDMAGLLDPDQPEADISPLSDLPESFLRSEFHAPDASWLELLRNHPDILQEWYNLESGNMAGHALEERQKMVDAECRILGLCSAIEDYHRARNEAVPESVVQQSVDMTRQSEKRLSAYLLDLDEVLEEAQEDVDFMTHVTAQRDKAKAGYLDQIYKHGEYASLRAHSLNMLAHAHLNVADAYFRAAGLHMMTMVLRLEAEPRSFGSGEHRALFAAVRNDLKHAGMAIGFAKQASPRNAPERDEDIAAGYGAQRPS